MDVDPSDTSTIINTLRSVPTIGGATLLGNSRELVYWQRNENQTDIRFINSKGESIKRSSIDFEPKGWEMIHEVYNGIVINSNPESYFVNSTGELSEFLTGNVYTQIHDINPDKSQVFYLHYGHPWEFRAHDCKTENSWTISKHPEQTYHAGFSPNGEYIAYRRNKAEESTHGTCVVATSSGDIEWEGNIGNPHTNTLLHDWHPDGTRLLLSDRTTDTYRLGVFNWQSNDVTWIADSNWPEFGIQFTPDGDQVLAFRHQDGSDILLKIDLQQYEIQTLDLPTGIFIERSKFKYSSTPRFFTTDSFFIRHTSSRTPSRLLKYNLQTDESTVLIEPGSDALNDISQFESRYIRYESTDSWTVGAVLYDSGVRPSPAIILIHGGPTRSEKQDFDPFAQLLANCGYTVLKPNYRGSTNHGKSFEKAIRGDVGGGEVEDIANGARWLATRDWIDEDRIAVYGHSHGALNAGLQAVRFSELYRVAFISNGYLEFTNKTDGANTFANRSLIDEAGETFNRERRVPKRADEIDCPICIIWGGKDHGQEAVEHLTNQLEERGWREGDQYRVVIFEDEGHEIMDKKALWSLIIQELSTRFE